MSFSSFLFGKPAETKRFDTLTPQQQGWQNQLGQQSSQALGNTNLDYGPIRNQIMKQFETQTVPGLLERLQGFKGAGTGNNSALGAQLGGSLEDLGGQLAAGESQYNLNKYQALLGGLNTGLHPQFETAQFGAQPGFLQSLSGGLGQSVGQSLPLMSLLSQYGQGAGQSQGSTGFQQQGGGSNTVQSLLQLIGLIGGGAVGGPGGAALGSMAGGAAGSLFGGR